MDRREFEKLDVLDQIDYFNKMLYDNISNNKLCEMIGIPRTTIRDRFNKAGYKFDMKEKCYKSITSKLLSNNISNTKVTPEEKLIDIKPILSNAAPIYMENLDQIMDIVNFKNDLIELINLKKEIKETIDTVKKYEFEKDVIDIPDIKIDLSKLSGVIKNRSFKVYEDVLEKFLDFAKKNNNFKQQDLLSQAMIEFIERYDR